MVVPFIGYTASKYKIHTDVYTGPLDLLLQLIEVEELDITQLALAKVTDQYLEHLKAIQEHDPLEVSAFLVTAAQLVLIKSKTLLPQLQSNIQEMEEDLGEALIQQLIIYKRFKHVGNWLKEKENSGLKTYLRVSQPLNIIQKLDVSDITIADLSNTFLEALHENQEYQRLDRVITISKVTIRKRIRAILTVLQSSGKTNFSKIVPNSHSHLEIAITFLALLELIKYHLIHASQQEVFGEITIESIGDLDQNIDTEF
ncbi:MAG TPA: segregation/condensation protein A [Anaerolineae bacterium]|nr:segregation/condensation protein A [Anaerolineae bacterium]